MNILVTYRVMAFMAVIEQAGLPALRVAFTIVVIVFLFGGYVIFRKRHQFFDRDPNVSNDVSVLPTQSSGRNPICLGCSDAGPDQYPLPGVDRMT